MTESSVTYLDINSIELHYYFTDSSHSMDAIVQNKCEFEFLGIIKNIAINFEVDIIIETEPLNNGGLRRWFKIINKEENGTASITIAVITTLITTVLTTPITKSIEVVVQKSIEKLFEDKELKELEKEKIRQEIENLKVDTETKSRKLYNNTAIIKKRSNFYEILEQYPKVEKLGIQVQNINKQLVSENEIIDRMNFKEFILASDELEPVEVENAIIEIISPVLKKGAYKWRGIYNGEAQSFNMKSNEFKTLVQIGKIEFKNGSSIKCLLELKKKINGEGVEEITEYNVIRVDEYFENDKPMETQEGKSHRQKQEANKMQLKIF